MKTIKGKFGDKGLGFIVEHNLHVAYLQLLTMAGGRQDVGILHDLLPENCRLDGPRLVELKSLWSEIRGTETTMRRVITDDAAMEILTFCCPRQGLGRWYVLPLLTGRPQRVSGTEFAPGFDRLIWPHEILRPFSPYLVADISGLSFDVHCVWVSELGRMTDRVVVALVGNKLELTLEKVRAVKNWIQPLPAVVSIRNTFVDGRDASDLFSGFLVCESPELRNLALHDYHDHEIGIRIRGALVQPGFLEKLAELMRLQGVPVQKIEIANPR